ncbi:uncharacterized protein LOC129269981 [Lytechinus pictus]|uniref:uncharacterized protein LOC129269981 n=1 Tax=Lytechinus pictus TaxID=7653 RepID=UPI0030B9BF9D
MRNYKRKTETSYTKQSLIDAVEAIKEGKMGLKKASKIYGISRTTLQKRVQGKISIDVFGGGRKTVLPKHVEDEMARCLGILASWGLGFTKAALLDLVADYVKTCNIENPFTDGRPGIDWYKGFMDRHPSLSLRKQEQLRCSGAKLTEKETVDHWFELLGKTLKDLSLENKPFQIYTVDVNGLPLDPSKLKRIAEKGLENVFQIIGSYSGGSEREKITVSGCGSASGHVLPPYVLYSGKNLNTEWTKDGVPNARYNTSHNGWMEAVTLFDWFQNMFLPNIPQVRPVLLIFDGTASHITFPLVKLASENEITILPIPSSTTHYLNPLNVSVYGPVKTAWEKILLAYATENLGRALVKDEFPRLVKDLWNEEMKPESLVSGFKSCGIMPFNASAVPESTYKASAALKPNTVPSFVYKPDVCSDFPSTSRISHAMLPSAIQPEFCNDSSSTSGLSRAPPHMSWHAIQMKEVEGIRSPLTSSLCGSTSSTSPLNMSVTPDSSSSTQTSAENSTPAIAELFAKHIQSKAESNRPSKRQSERVLSEIVTKEHVQPLKQEHKVKRRRKSENPRKTIKRLDKKYQQHERDELDNLFDDPVEVLQTDNETQKDGKGIERCDACGKIYDTTNSDQFIGCDLCPKRFCKSAVCCGLDLLSEGDVTTVSFVCNYCQEIMYNRRITTLMEMEHGRKMYAIS